VPEFPFLTSGRAAGKVMRGDNHTSRSVRERGRGTVRIRYADHVQGLLREEIHASSTCERLILKGDMNSDIEGNSNG